MRTSGCAGATLERLEDVPWVQAPLHGHLRTLFHTLFFPHRSEKRVLNDINKRTTGEARVKYPLPADGPPPPPGRPRKPKERVAKASEKIWILVGDSGGDLWKRTLR